MKIADFNPNATKWREGKTHKASSWTAVDTFGVLGKVRSVYHYGTLMVQWYRPSDDKGWRCEPVSTGRGSVSDQSGIRKLDCGFRMVRKGGHVHYVNMDGKEVHPF